MSKGLGRLQREIIAALETRPGGDMIVDGCGHHARLAADTHDLRQLLREMTRAAETPACEYVSSVWPTSFYRAVAKLADRGALNVLWLVPIKFVELGFAWPTSQIDGILYMRWYSRQRRFVGNRPNFRTLKPAYVSEYAADSLY